MSFSTTFTDSITFTVTHARPIGAKVATDLHRMQRLYRRIFLARRPRRQRRRRWDDRLTRHPGAPRIKAESLIDPARITDAFHYLHTHHPSC